MKETGLIKYHCSWKHSKPVDETYVQVLNKWRDKIYAAGLIGVGDDGVGFGNISIRYCKDQFIITGSGTGLLESLTPQHYSLVTGYDLNTHTLNCEGAIKASSESMSHATLYSCDAAINAVIHVHSLILWKKLLNQVPTTVEKAEYGSKELTDDIRRLFKETDLPKQKLLVMAGHEAGIISFGKDIDEAGTIILDNYGKSL